MPFACLKMNIIRCGSSKRLGQQVLDASATVMERRLACWGTAVANEGKRDPAYFSLCNECRVCVHVIALYVVQAAHGAKSNLSTLVQTVMPVLHVKHVHTLANVAQAQAHTFAKPNMLCTGHASGACTRAGSFHFTPVTSTKSA